MKYYTYYPYFLEKKEGYSEKPKKAYVFFVHKFITVEAERISIIEKISGDKVNTVTYKINTDFEKTRSLNTFHCNNYAGVLMKLEKKLSENLFFCSNYKENIFIGSDFISLNKKGEGKVSYALNKNYELIEYRETFYDHHAKAISEKHFFPQQWHIDLDDFR